MKIVMKHSLVLLEEWELENDDCMAQSSYVEQTHAGNSKVSKVIAHETYKEQEQPPPNDIIHKSEVDSNEFGDETEYLHLKATNEHCEQENIE